MDYKKLGLVVALCLCAIVGGLIYLRDHVIEKTVFIPDITDLTENYLARDEIAAAMKKLEDPDLKAAEVITPLQDGAPRMALLFDGLPERPLTARLLDVLAKHKAQAVFFVEGENAADQPETIRLIREAGQEIGNYTYVGLAALEKQPPEMQLTQICRAQKVATMEDSIAPTLFRAPRTFYSDDLLKAVRAAGLEYAVKENVRFQPNTLHTQQEADAYAATIPKGSIIAIPVGRPVEQKATDSEVHEETPAVDMKPTIKEDHSAPVPPHEDLADELDRLLTALEAQGNAIDFVNQFRKIHFIPGAIPQPQGGTANG